MKLALLTSAFALTYSSTVIADSPLIISAHNKQAEALLQGCANLIGTDKPSGFYWVSFNVETQVLMYCDNEREYEGVKGGWTLVWSNLRGGKGKITSDMHWGASIHTLPRYRGAAALPPGADRQSFEVYTGLKWWKQIMSRKEMMYEWAHDYGDQRQIDQRAACAFDLNQPANWTITFVGPRCVTDPGSVMPGFFTYSSGRPWTTIDRDNDTWSQNCGGAFTTGSPWWYGSCWSGSISGGGEASGGSHLNGAYWAGAQVRWGNADGTGAGNGWIYIR